MAPSAVITLALDNNNKKLHPTNFYDNGLNRYIDVSRFKNKS